MKKENKKDVKTQAPLADAVPTEKPAKKEIKGSRKAWLAGTVAVVVVGALIVSQLCCPVAKAPKSYPSRVDEGIVVAEVGGEKVKLADLEAVKNGVPQLKEMPMETVYNKLLEAYVNNRVILNAAKKSGVQNLPEVKKMLSDAEDQILFQAYLSQQLQARMTPEKLNAIYMAEIQNYVPQDEIHARHILVATEKEAKDLIVKLKNGADFEKLANEYSLDKNPENENGGDLGYFRKDMMIPEFGNAAFAIKVGQISQKPIKTPFGWHVVKVEDKRKAAPPTMAEMGEVIKARFTEATVPVILEEERAKADVKLFDPLGVNKVAPASVEAAEPAEPAAPVAPVAPAEPAPAEEAKADK